MDSSHPYKNRFLPNKNCKKPDTDTSTAQNRTPSSTPKKKRNDKCSECSWCDDPNKKCLGCGKFPILGEYCSYANDDLNQTYSR